MAPRKFILLATPAVILLDLPASLTTPPDHILRSTPPQTHPFTLPEPKNPPPPTAADETHARLLPSILAALSSIPPHTTHYHPRNTSPPPPEPTFDAAHLSLLTPQPDLLLLSDPNPTLDDVSELYRTPVINTLNTWLTLTLRFPPPAARFLVPPRASFYLGPLLAGRGFTDVVGGRDFVLLDPPWPNKSAQRKRKAGGYGTADRFGIEGLLAGMRLAEVLEPGKGLVAVWITNKSSVREVLGRVLEGWGCVVEAEWVWVKVTGGGEPVVGLEARGRRAYEVLVVARRRGVRVGERVRDKVLVAVPDFHSRKPGIRALVEEYLPSEYRAAEIFGRGLTEGWFTWGDEALRWNWEGHWVKEECSGEGLEGLEEVSGEGLEEVSGEGEKGV